MIESNKKIEHFEDMYKRLMREVGELATSAQNSIQNMSSRFLIGRFDELVQFALLSAASSCGEYTAYDNALIERVATYSTVFEPYNDIEGNRNATLELDWERLYKIMNLNGPAGIKAALSSFMEIIAPRTEFMVKALAPVACMHYRNYFYEITKRLRYTVSSYINATVDSSEIEIKEAKARVAQVLINEIFITPWTYECETYCKEFLKDEEALKRFYDGKKQLEEIDILDNGENDNEDF